MTDTRTEIIEAKRHARAVSRRRGTSYQSELEAAARREGYEDWKGMLAGDRPAPPSQGTIDRAEAFILVPFARLIGVVGPITFLVLYALIQITCLVLSLSISRDGEGQQGAVLALFGVIFVLMSVGTFLLEGRPRRPRTMFPFYETMMKLHCISIVILTVFAICKTLIAPDPVQLWYAENRPVPLAAFAVLTIMGFLSFPFARTMARRETSVSGSV